MAWASGVLLRIIGALLLASAAVLFIAWLLGLPS